MKKFRFKYEKILQLRLDRENDVKNQLAEINQKIIGCEAIIEGLKLEEKNFQKNIEAEMIKGVSAGQLQANAHNKAYLKEKLTETKEKLNAFLKERIEIQKNLIEANKERKVMEKLREKEVKAYKALEELEDRQLIDQVVTYQSSKKRGDL